MQVTGVPTDALGLRADLYPLDDDPIPTPITLNSAGGGVYTGTFMLDYPLPGAYVHIQTTDGPTPTWETVTSEVPTGEESGIQVYYRSPTETAWKPITITLDTYFNLASIPTQGPGLYALMSSIHVSLPTAGWNNISYPVSGSHEIGLALGAISGKYQIAYSYVLTDTLDPWKVYAPAPTPTWVNDLRELRFGQGYWIYATQATDLRLKGSSGLVGLAGTLSLPPATIYGVLPHGTAGQVVEAQAQGGAVCGSGTTRIQDGQVVFVVKVAAAGSGNPACGATGSIMTVMVNGKSVGQVWWDNSRATNLTDATRIYIPMIYR